MNKITTRLFFLAIAGVFGSAAFACAQTTPAPVEHKHADMQKTEDAKADDHHATVMKNGEKAMGFSQTATTHHFLLFADGGAIQVEANDAKDTENRDKVRSHLTGIAKQFQEGIFTTPFAVHGVVPPGVPEMDRLKASIIYSFEETKNGARVRIKTNNADALAAIHQFLKFQITDHKTGDPLSVK